MNWGPSFGVLIYEVSYYFGRISGAPDFLETTVRRASRLKGAKFGRLCAALKDHVSLERDHGPSILLGLD